MALNRQTDNKAELKYKEILQIDCFFRCIAKLQKFFVIIFLNYFITFKMIGYEKISFGENLT